MPRPSHPSWFDQPNNVWWAVQCLKLPTVRFSSLSFHFVPSKSKNCPQRLFRYILSQCCSVTARGRVSHPYKTAGETVMLCILLCLYPQRDEKCYTENVIWTRDGSVARRARKRIIFKRRVHFGQIWLTWRALTNTVMNLKAGELLDTSDLFLVN